MGVTVRQKEQGGPWWVFIKHHGKRRSKCIGDKKAANNLAKELREALAAGDLGLIEEPAPSEGLSFESYADQYLTRMESQLKRSTWVDYNGCTRRQLIPALGEKLLAAITRADVKALAASLQAKGLSTINVRKHLRILSSILSEAVEDELIASNPVRELRKLRHSKLPHQRRKVDVVTAKELAHLLETARTHTIGRRDKTVHPYRRYYPFLLCLARTGLRLGEAIALRWGDVDWHGGFIHVQRSYSRGELSTPKSGKDRRVDMSSQLQRVLRALYEERFERAVAIDPEAQAALEVERAAALEAIVFVDEVGGHIDEANFRHRIWGPLLTAAKLRHLRLHDLRHTCASLLIAGGAELQYVQQQLGHHSPAFTLTVYGHLLPKDRRGMVDQLDDAAPAGTPAAPDTRTTVLRPVPEERKALVAQGLS